MVLLVFKGLLTQSCKVLQLCILIFISIFSNNFSAINRIFWYYNTTMSADYLSLRIYRQVMIIKTLVQWFLCTTYYYKYIFFRDYLVNLFPRCNCIDIGVIRRFKSSHWCVSHHNRVYFEYVFYSFNILNMIESSSEHVGHFMILGWFIFLCANIY